jgi:hypothetical protein
MKPRLTGDRIKRLRTIITSDGHGGVFPTSTERAKKVELITLPMDVTGKSCGTCQYFEEESRCVNKEVMMPVTRHQGCRLWDAPGVFKAYRG